MGTEKRSNVASGLLIVLGAGLIAFASQSSLLRWSTPISGISVGKLSLKPDALIPGASSLGPQDRQAVLLLAGALALLGILVMVSRVPGLGLVLKASAVAVSVVPGLFALSVWSEIQQWTSEDASSSALRRFVSHGVHMFIHPLPTAGLYGLSAGCGLILVAFFVPAKRWVDEAVAPTRWVDETGTPTRWVDEPAGSPPHRLPTTGKLIGVAACLALAAVVAVVVVFAIGRGPGSSSSSGIIGSLDSSLAKTTEVERDCITSTVEQDDNFMQQATVASAQDADKSVLNLDGDSSYELYADHIQALDTSACPEEFQLAYERWGSLWLEYGKYLKEAAKPHALWNDEWSDGSKQTRDAEFKVRVHALREALRESALVSGVKIPRGQW